MKSTKRGKSAKMRGRKNEKREENKVEGNGKK